MRECEELILEEGRGISGDHTLGRLRHVTLVFEDDWSRATAELGLSVDPAGRRANVLVSGGDGTRWLKRTVRLGETRIEIKGITAPCPVMDRAAPGLMAALKPEGRAGIWGRVVGGGRLRKGDRLEPEQA